MKEAYRVNARMRGIYIGIIILFVSVFVIVNYVFNRSRNLLIAQEAGIISQYMNRNELAVEEITDSIRKISAASSTNKQVAAWLNQSYAGSVYSSDNAGRIRSVVETMTFYRNIFFDYRLHYIIQGIDGTVYSVVDGIDNSIYFGEQFSAGARQQEWYQGFMDGGTVSVWVAPCIYNPKGQFQEQLAPGQNEAFILFVRRIRDYNSQKYLGISFVSFPTENLSQILIPYQGSAIALLDGGGQLIYAPEPSPVLADIAAEAQQGQLAENDGYFYHEQDGVEYLIHYAYLPGPDWKLVNVVPLAHITRAVDELYNMVSLLMALMALGASAICLLMYIYINAPLNWLIRKISRVNIGGTRIFDAQGTGMAKTPIFGIKEAEREIGRMVDYIERLSAQTIKQKEIEQNLRFEMLRARLRPHFLFNTLNAIKWSALVSGAGNIADMLASLGILLESSMDRQGSQVSLGDELKVVMAWVEIKNWSVKNRIQVHAEIPEELLDFKVIRFFLQPLVENAVLHGVEPVEHGRSSLVVSREMEGQSDRGGLGVPEGRPGSGSLGAQYGEIRIRAERNGDRVTVTVADNGIGIAPEKLDKILEEMESGQERHVTGIGLGESNLRDTLGLLNRSLKTHLNLSVSLGIGMESLELGQLVCGYQQARRLAKLRFFGGGASLYTREANFKNAYINKRNVRKQIQEAIFCMDPVAAYELADQWFDHMKQMAAYGQIARIRRSVAETWIFISGYTLPDSVELQEPDEISIDDFWEAQTLDELRVYFKAAIRAVLDYLQANKTAGPEIMRLLYYLEGHVDENISLERASKRCGLGKSQFCILFKKATGDTFINYFNRIKMKAAYAFLSSGNFQVQEAANLVGMRDISYFSRMFKKYNGVNPSDVRRHEWELSSKDAPQMRGSGFAEV